MHPLEYFLTRVGCLKSGTSKEQILEVLGYLSSYSNLYLYPDKSQFTAFASDDTDDEFKKFMNDYEGPIHKLLEAISDHPAYHNKGESADIRHANFSTNKKKRKSNTGPNQSS